MNKLYLILRFLSSQQGMGVRAAMSMFSIDDPNLIKFTQELITKSPSLVEYILNNRNEAELILNEAWENWQDNNPTDYRNSLEEFIDYIYLNKTIKTLWYPACGSDLRVLHHTSTNNISVSNDFFILSDIANYNENVNEIISREGFRIAYSDSGTFYFYNPNLQENIPYNYLVLEFDNGYIKFERKCLILWEISNENLIDVFSQIPNFKLETLFVKRCNDELIFDQVRATLDRFSCRYYINSFYSLGLISNKLHEEVVSFSRNQNLLLRAINGYEGVGSNNTDSLEFVFTFERVE